MESLSDPNYQVILTQLCLALADLALQMVQWKNSASDLIQRWVNYQLILTQLCLALADLALQMVQW